MTTPCAAGDCVPPEALAAALATGALTDPFLTDRTRVKILLEAAEPHIRRDERDRLQPLIDAGNAMARHIETEWSPVVISYRPSAAWRNAFADLLKEPS
jgi:hypothetical protein